MARSTDNQGWGNSGFHFPSASPAMIRTVILGVLVLVLLVTSYYQIEPAEVGVIQRFGKYVRSSDPGPHLKIPFGIESVTRVPVQRQLKEEFGFRTALAGVASSYHKPNADTLGESQMLTGDLNVAVVEWIVQYRIKDARAYLFHIRDVRETFRYMSEAAMRQVVGDHSVDEVITIGREDIARAAKVELQRLCDTYGIGIEVLQLVLQDVNPPDAVKPAFNEVNQAIQEKERAINDAWAEYNQVVPRAKGEAEQAVRAAEGYAIERENNAKGDATRFDAVYQEYRKAPGVTRKRIYLESMAQILPKVGRQIIVDDKAKGLLSLLPLDLGKGVKP
ncbi:MAG: FtsH protease activity modulator HflK [Deltaproteobacteria bacterium]|nr:FtsH protease activity modulator HflK [Deltaproteobacteria bacterium]